MDNNWKYNQWEELGIDDMIEGPVEDDHCNRPHGLKPVVSRKFETVLHCILKTTAMDHHFFARLVTQSNKMARQRMAERNSTLFLGHVWKNISVGEMIRFFGIMLQISLDPRKMGGY